MSRPQRIEFAGACYHVMARGNARERIYLDDTLGSVSYCYDARGNLLEKVRSSQAVPTGVPVTNELRYRVGYRYTLANQLAAVIYPDGDELRYTRNSAGQITSVVYATKQSNGSFLTETVVQSAQYAPFGPLTQLSFGNGSQWTRTLDQNYAIDAITSAALNLDATLDDAGNFTGLISSGQSYEFDYDPLYRLTDLIQGSSVLEHFDYDATGNRTAANIGGAAQSYAYPANNHRLQSVNGTSRDYDNAGNTTLRDGLNYTYNGRNRLSRVSMGRTTYYAATYNARGEREEKTLTAGMTTQRFIYDEAGRLIQTGNVPNIGLTRTLKPEQRLLWLDDQLVGVKLKTTSGTYAGELLYAHTDHLGTPRALMRQGGTGNLGTVVWRWPLETTAFGQHPAQTDPDGDGQALTFNLRYPGQYFDAESGLHYNYFRDYEAGTGRYIESDPVGLDGGINTFAYVGQNPLLRFDQTGLKVEMRCRSVGAPFNPGFRASAAALLGGEHCYLVVSCPMAGIPNSHIGYPDFISHSGSPPTNDRLYSSEGRYRDLPVAPPRENPNDCLDCDFERCIYNYANILDFIDYRMTNYSIWGPNSNSFARRLVEVCGGSVGGKGPPTGWDDAGSVGF